MLRKDAHWVGAVLALSVALAQGCGSSTEPRASGEAGGAGGQGGSMSSGGGGMDIPLNMGGAGGDGDCARLEGGAVSVPWSGVPAQDYCDGSAQNPPECPAVKPEPGSPCSPKDIACGYVSGAEWLVTTRCEAFGWSTVGHACATSCAPAAPEDAVVGAPACGSLPDIPCDDRAMLTDQERLTWVLGEVADCCGYWIESITTVWLEDGCAVAVRNEGPGGTYPGFTECLRGLLGGRRFSCGTGLSCASVEWSTIN